MKKSFKITFLLVVVLVVMLGVFLGKKKKTETVDPKVTVENGDGNPAVSKEKETVLEMEDKNNYPMSLEVIAQSQYPKGDFSLEQVLPNGSNYKQSVVSYKSEGLKIYGLLTVPLAPKPPRGYPAVVFVHGHIPPEIYSTTGSYPTYQATLARGGFVTFKPDLRGHGKSEGEAVSAHFSEKYTVDVLNAISHLQNFDQVDPEKIGYWGHSNGGEIGLRVIVVSPHIKASVFWAGVVGSYEDMFETYNNKIPFLQGDNPLVEKYGLPSQKNPFWKHSDPYFNLDRINTPIQIHHGDADKSVPVELSRRLKEELEKTGKEVEYFEYIGDDHNISVSSSLAWKRSINFFKENL